MLLQLSARYQRPIAFGLLYIFLLAGTMSFAGSIRATPLPYLGPLVTATRSMDKTNGTAELPVNKLSTRGALSRSGAAGLRSVTGGPSQPEMTAFRPVGADNLVDLFTGDFSYNIPLMDVGGYPINIFYNSGITMDQEASWVGLGWNINPGTITRNMRGLPDDFNGSEILTKKQFMKADRTYGVSVGGSLELFGLKTSKLSLDAGIFYNNQRGIGLQAGISPMVGIGAFSGDEKTAPLNFGWSLRANSQSGASQTFSIVLKDKEKSGLNGSLSASMGYHSRMGLQSLHLEAELSKSLAFNKNADAVRSISDGLQVNPTMGTTISFAYPAVTPSIKTRQHRVNYSLDLGTGVDGWGAFGNVRLGGYYTATEIKDPETRQPVYGMLYLQNATNNKDALLDFNRLNDGVYTPNSPIIGIPAYTYDVFSISGEGTGGSFRAYRGDLGYVNDPYMETQSDAGHLGIELGGGAYGKGGVNANLVLSPSSAGVWNAGNLAKTPMDFRQSYGAYQSVYFKNPGEKAIPDTVYQNAIGGEDLVRLKMSGLGVGAPSLMPSFVKYGDTRQRKGELVFKTPSMVKQRDKRTQVISFLTAEEADRIGYTRKIPSVNAMYDYQHTVFGCNGGVQIDSIKRYDMAGTSPVFQKRSHHISEVNVLTDDGRRYVYGIPVYTKQVDVTFNKQGDAATQTANYTTGDKTPGSNTHGKDEYVERQEMPAYTHSFLLTALLSPNYVDLTGDGISQDDMGDGIKFNYGKLAQPLKWRTPAGTNTATYSEGLKGDPNDDKAHFIYGEREMWYLYSVESKNLVARFYVTADRRDAKSVVGEDGGLDENWGAQRLMRISLFSKADLRAEQLNPSRKAKPIKTVHFEYDYSLCGNHPANDGKSVNKAGEPVSDPNSAANINKAKGKLTLRSIYFTYNGNDNVRKNPYKFNYATDAERNPNYDFTAVDRWGNYKPASGNQGGLGNPDFPYAEKSKIQADKYAAAWCLQQVVLPSGGALNVEYEADDYSYVQDRRAANMYRVLGFGSKLNPTSAELNNNTLYKDANNDHAFIYIEVPGPVSSPTDVERLYLPGLSKSRQLFMKLAVDILSKDVGTPKGFEMIPIYATVKSFGVIPSAGNNTIYIEVDKLESGFTPMVQHSLQFMKNFLPAKAYPGYDVSESGGIKQIVKAMGGLFRSYREAFSNGMVLFKRENKCKYVETGKSFVRLANPTMKKIGGGLRVKKIVIQDNWDKMTKNASMVNGESPATYGQEYFYTKKEMLNGQLQEISSGVASWEPSIGGEENPHREVMSYFNKNKMGPYDYGTVELPLAEMFFPSPSIGYSRVEVKSIHRDTVKNAAGVQVTEFYTTREFPTRTNYTPLEEYDAKDLFEPSPVLQLLKLDINRATALSQGFKVELNDMNGKMKKQSTYAPNNPNQPISYTENFYNVSKSGDNSYRFNHYLPVVHNGEGKITPGVIIGREIELMTDFRQHKLETVTTNLNFNLDVISGLFIPIPVPTFFSPVQRESDIYRSSSVLKVVNHYAVLDSVVAVDKGSMISTKNLVFDAETGNPLLTRTQNEFNQPLYNFTYPAQWTYPGMGSAYKNIDVIYRGLTFRYGILETGGVDLGLFESGDELYVVAENSNGPEATAPCDPAKGGYLEKSTANRIWAISPGKSGNNRQGFVFIDAAGNPFTAKDASIRIVRSGKRNLLSASVCGVLSLKKPIKETGNGTFIDFTDASVLKTSANTFKDHWRVDDQLVVKDSFLITKTAINPTLFETVATDIMTVTKDENNFSYSANSYATVSTLTKDLAAGKYRIRKAWMKFDGLQTLLNSNIHPDNFIDASSTTLTTHSHLSGYSSGECSWQNYDNDHPGVHQPWNPGTSYANRYPFLGNTTIVQLVKENTWPSPTDYNQWNSLFSDNNNYSPVNVISQPAQGGFIMAQTGYTYFVNQLMREMFWRKKLGLPLQPAFSFQIFQNSLYENEENMRCTRPDVDCQWFDPKLRFFYYDCSEPVERIPNTTTAYCITKTFVQSFCYSKYKVNKSINPYVEGIWGNWRVDTSFVYYGKRKEDLSGAVDLRTGGTIDNFKPFWTFAQPLLKRDFTTSDVWVWNSLVTQYNNKGYDIENKDPLQRFNAGLYGYAQQLPIAVVNNSRYRESMFDGFEDYDFTVNACATSACKPPRHATFTDVEPFITENAAHTGIKSILLPNNQSVALTTAVVNENQLDKAYAMRVRIDSVTYQDTVIVSQGSGVLTTSYYNHPGSYPNNSVLCPGGAGSTLVTSGVPAAQFPRVNGSYNNVSHPNGYTTVNAEYYSVKWKGKLVPDESAFYTFKATHDNGFRISINGNYITNNAVTYAGNCGTNNTPVQGVNQSSQVALYKGQQYDIEIDFYNQWGPGYFLLKWEKNGVESDIPARCLYPENYGTITVTNPTAWCSKVDSVQARGAATTDTFSLIQGRRMVVSAWVKEGGTDCKCTSYEKNNITVSFTGSSQTFTFKPSGNIIEGWQRYESDFIIPSGATAIQVQLNNVGATAGVYFDDVRIHPYNANMKSFVYHASNLRLMAELDENNYAAYYEYDTDGTLTRVKKETERGVKTIKETRSALQKSIE